MGRSTIDSAKTDAKLLSVFFPRLYLMGSLLLAVERWITVLIISGLNNQQFLCHLALDILKKQTSPVVFSQLANPVNLRYPFGGVLEVAIHVES